MPITLSIYERMHRLIIEKEGIPVKLSDSGRSIERMAQKNH